MRETAGSPADDPSGALPTSDEPVRAADELAALWRNLPPIGEWVEDASCGPLADVEVWTADHPDVEELAVAERVCRRCPVRQECASYAASTAVWGLWAGTWHGGRRTSAA